MISGIIMIQDAAHNGPQSVPALCTNASTPSGRVLSSEAARSTDDQSSSPHQDKKVKIATVAVAGSIIGNTIFPNIFTSPHPSILAASIISVGTVRKKL